MIDRLPRHVPQILINMESLSHMRDFDIHLIGYCDIITTKLQNVLLNKQDNITFRPGQVEHKWLFDGAIEKIESSSECESGSESSGSLNSSTCT